ncbi:hypothetical protein ASF12_03460 [Paenibacillus sp. Leaf72]|nr:hypothetical protein ASF12_03460 [Paenibacillus sp. Leaf72]
MQLSLFRYSSKQARQGETAVAVLWQKNASETYEACPEMGAIILSSENELLINHKLSFISF